MGEPLQSTFLTFSEVKGTGVFTFLTSISLAESQVLKREMQAILRSTVYAQVLLRMDRVHYLDSSGLGIFVALQHEFRGTTRFRFTGVRPNVRMVFEFSHLLHYFTIDDVGPGAAMPQPAVLAPAKVAEPDPQEFLGIEGKYILTEDGVNYCIQKQIPVQDLRLYRGALVPGFTWASVNPKLLERFVTHGLMAGMELERTQFLEKREQILRLIEVVFDGITMKRFRPLLKVKLMEDPAYRKLLSQGVSPQRLRAALSHHSQTISRLKDELESQILLRSTKAPQSKVARILSLVDDSVWFLLIQAQSSAGNRQLRQTVMETLVRYCGRLELSESIALNLMEFIQQAEKAHFMNLAERDPFTRKDPGAIPELLADPRFRERLVAKAKLQNEFLVMNMNFDGNPHDSLTGLVVEISVRNKGVAGNTLRSETLAQKARDRSAPLPQDGMEELELWNLNFLKGLCQDQGITIETTLRRDERSDETIASMRLVL